MQLSNPTENSLKLEKKKNAVPTVTAEQFGQANVILVNPAGIPG